MSSSFLTVVAVNVGVLLITCCPDTSFLLKPGLVTALSHPTPPHRKRQEQKIRLAKSGNEATLVARTVPIPRLEEEEDSQSCNCIDEEYWSITVWEWKNPSQIVQAYWDCATSINVQQQLSSAVLDPFGLVSWPGSVRAAQEMRLRREIAVQNQTVLILGCGVGLEVQAAIQLGARHVIATDIHPTTLQQARFGFEKSFGNGNGLQQEQQQQQQQQQAVLTTQILDIAASADQQPLPVGFDTVVIADVLYNEQLARHVCRRMAEAVRTNPKCRILITDSQRFVPTFISDLNNELQTVWDDHHQQQHHDTIDSRKIKSYTPLTWEIKSQSFTGSGVMIDEDQTYDVKVQSLWVGLL
jgi:predicted nicotinamide N-methyase